MSRRPSPIWTGWVATALLFCGIGAAQEPSPAPMRTSIQVVGEAEVRAKPEQAEIDIGVVSRAASAEVAAAENAEKLDAVLRQVREVLGPSASIETKSYSVRPDVHHPRDGGEPTITGYTASNILELKAIPLDEVGRVIDRSTQSGANTIHSLRFVVRDEQALQLEALRHAAVRARARAEALAEALGLRIVRILEVTDGLTPVPRPMAGGIMPMAEARAVPTPIQPGEVEVRATVTLTVETASK